MLLAEHSPNMTQELGPSVGSAEMRVPVMRWSLGLVAGGPSPEQPRHPLGQDSTYQPPWPGERGLPSRAASGLQDLGPLASPGRSASPHSPSRGALLLEGVPGTRVNVLDLFQSPTVPL